MENIHFTLFEVASGRQARKRTGSIVRQKQEAH